MVRMICYLYTFGAPHVINPRPFTRIKFVLGVMHVMRVMNVIHVMSPTSFPHMVSVFTF